MNKERLILVTDKAAHGLGDCGLCGASTANPSIVRLYDAEFQATFCIPCGSWRGAKLAAALKRYCESLQDAEEILFRTGQAVVPALDAEQKELLENVEVVTEVI